MRLAFVVDGLVAQVLIDPPAGRLSSAYRATLIECPDEVGRGWHYDGTDFTSPTAEELAEKAQREEDADRRTRVLDILDKLMDTLEAKDVLTQAEIADIWEAGK